MRLGLDSTIQRRAIGQKEKRGGEKEREEERKGKRTEGLLKATSLSVYTPLRLTTPPQQIRTHVPHFLDTVLRLRMRPIDVCFEGGESSKDRTNSVLGNTGIGSGRRRDGGWRGGVEERTGRRAGNGTTAMRTKRGGGGTGELGGGWSFRSERGQGPFATRKSFGGI
jgi:hypothetical protein